MTHRWNQLNTTIERLKLLLDVNMKAPIFCLIQPSILSVMVLEMAYCEQNQ